jgi:2-iminobutanoate/2-iminopropanoate deaminase
MERRINNPWTWQDQMGYVQANEVSGAQRTLFLAGQGSVDEEGRPVHPDDWAPSSTRRWTTSRRS